MIMKKIRKIFCLVLSLILILGIPMEAQAAVSKAKVRKAYKKYIEKNINLSDYPYAEFKYFDIDKDGIPEMIMQYEAGVRGNCRIYTYYKGKVILLHKEFNGCGQISWYKKYFVLHQSNGASDSSITVYKISNHKLKKVMVYRYYNDRVYKNGKRITMSQYSAFMKKLHTIS